MTERGYTLDANIVRPLLRNDEEITARVLDLLEHSVPVRINAIAYFETKRGLLAANATTQLKLFDELCETLGILPLGREVLDKASEIYADLRRQGLLIEDADLLIAASALVNDLCLVTHNTAHFSRVTGLIIEDWLADSKPKRARD